MKIKKGLFTSPLKFLNKFSFSALRIMIKNIVHSKWSF